MAKTAISLTIEQTNLLWLKGRARVVSGGSLSAAVDQLIAEARAGRLGQGEPPRSVVGTIDLPDDRALLDSKHALQELFTDSLARPLFVHESAPGDRAAKRAAKSKKLRG
jgi:hypothetical protein